MIKNSLKLIVCCIFSIGAAPVFAKAPAKQTFVDSAQWKRHRAIEESIGRMQLDNLIASIVDQDEKRPSSNRQEPRPTSSHAS